jgi:hypothetical protein
MQRQLLNTRSVMGLLVAKCGRLFAVQSIKSSLRNHRNEVVWVAAGPMIETLGFVGIYDFTGFLSEMP